jgi:hypothetical protein
MVREQRRERAHRPKQFDLFRHIPSFLFQLFPAALFRTLSILDQSARRFERQLACSMTVLPYHDNLILRRERYHRNPIGRGQDLELVDLTSPGRTVPIDAHTEEPVIAVLSTLHQFPEKVAISGA